ncbi:MAG: DctP family TRAP transporter solute-binding subunit [Magnetococcales bacterium]|nr:DctP family TRAP transporter solute-binding subunit [Magnetococcales bacterium]
MKLLRYIFLGVVFSGLSVLLVVWLVQLSIEQASISHPPTPSTHTIFPLRFGHNSPTDSALHVAAVRFAEEVGQKSGGKVAVSVHPFQELGNDDQMLEMARQGKLDIVLIPTAKMSVAVPALQFVDLPFYFPSPEILYHLLDGELGQLLLAKLRPIGLEGIAFWENGFKQFTSNQPIHGPDDFKGKKIRTMKSRIIMHHYEAMGAIPVLIDFHSTHQALVDKVVDGQENPLVAIVGLKIHEVQSHLTLSNHGYLGYVLAISGSVFQNLPGDIRTLLTTTGTELVAFERAETQRREIQFIEQVRKANVNVQTLTDGERQAFTVSAAHLPRHFESVIGPDILAKADDFFRSEPSRKQNKQEIIVGFDSDLSTLSIRSSLGIKQGAMLAMDEINRSGGVLGRPLQLVCRDNKAMPSRGVQNFQDLAAMPEVVAILGGTFSTIAELEAREAQRIGIPNLVPWAAGADIIDYQQKPNFTFRLSANDHLAGPFLAQAATKQFGKVALLLENSVWGRGNLASMGQYLEGVGNAPVHVSWINRGETNWPPIVDAIRKSGADAIVLVANTMEGAGLVKELISDHGKGHKIFPIIAHWGISNLWSQMGPLPPMIDLQILQTFSFNGNKTGNKAEQVLHLYQDFFFQGELETIPSPVGTAQAYDLIHLLAKAITRAGTTNRSAVRDALETIHDHDGLIKRYAPPFTPDRHDALDQNDYFLARFNAQGELIPSTHDLADRKPQ